MTTDSAVFKERLLDFLDVLHEYYPQEYVFIHAKVLIENFSESKVCEYIAPQFVLNKIEIRRKNINFLSKQESMFFAQRVSELWPELDDHSKDIVWQWINILLSDAEKVQHENKK